METPINKENEETESLEAEKVEALPKKKRIASEKQLKGMEIGRQKLKQKHEEARQKKLLEEEENKKQLEEKIVKKAVSIKKKQIKKELALDEISDDETPIEEIKQKIITKKTQPQEPPKPRYIFI
jgi:hypothetical protein